MRLILASTALLALASCSTPQVVPQPARPVPVPSPTPAPSSVPVIVPPAPRGADWRDWPLTPGTWGYRRDERGSIALFGVAGADAELTLRCDKTRGRIYLSRRAEVAEDLTIRTSTTFKALDTQMIGGTPAYAAAELMPRDPILDAIGFSRGRFVVQAERMRDLVLPAYPEILRVVEDCRG